MEEQVKRKSLVRTCVRNIKVAYVIYDGTVDGLNDLCERANNARTGTYYTTITRDNGHYIHYAEVSGNDGMFLVTRDNPVVVFDKDIRAMSWPRFQEIYNVSDEALSGVREHVFRARVHMEADLWIDMPGESKESVRESVDKSFLDTFREAMGGTYGGKLSVMSFGGKVEKVTELVEQVVTVEK